MDIRSFKDGSVAVSAYATVAAALTGYQNAGPCVINEWNARNGFLWIDISGENNAIVVIEVGGIIYEVTLVRALDYTRLTF